MNHQINYTVNLTDAQIFLRATDMMYSKVFFCTQRIAKLQAEIKGELHSEIDNDTLLKCLDAEFNDLAAFQLIQQSLIKNQSKLKNK